MKNNQNKFYGWKIAIVGFMLMSTTYAIVMNCAGLFVKPISDSLNASRSQVSLLPAIITLAFALSAPFVSKAINKYGIKSIMALGSLLIGGGLVGYSLASNIYILYVESILVGIGLAFSTLIPINMLINNWFIEKKGQITGIIFAGSGVGGFLFTQVTIYMLNNYTWNKAYLVLGIVSLVLTLPLILVLVKKSPDEVNQKPYGYKEIQGNINAEEVSGYMLKDIKKSVTFKTIALSCFLINLIILGIVTHFPSHLLDLGYDTSFVANASSIYLLSVIVAKVLLGSIFDKLGGKKGFLIGTSSFILGSLAMIFASFKIVAIAFGVLFAIGAGMATVSIPFLVGDIFGKKDYAAIFGLLTLLGTLGAVLGAPISGIIYDKFGSYNGAWVLYIVLSIIMCGLVFSSYKSAENIKINRDVA
ncbi:MFS transporter [Tepidibacter sp. Z1-5]|uniref:MFS transporter n=1 Tax=Tepidibacter sp. Z1-5 TaxID=3134138 RepID=UPI0030C1C74B